nr:MAG TPA: hypothetical protein [Caudoviricetes sp.]
MLKFYHLILYSIWFATPYTFFYELLDLSIYAQIRLYLHPACRRSLALRPRLRPTPAVG